MSTTSGRANKMNLRELINKLAAGEGPESLEDYLDKFVPDVLLKSDNLQQAYGVTNKEMDELYYQGYKYYQEDKYGDSVVLFRWLVILNPFVVKYWMGFAASQQFLGEYEKALHSYAMWALMADDDPMPHFHAYECYKKMNNPQDERKALEQAHRRAVNKPVYSEIRQEIEQCLQR